MKKALLILALLPVSSFAATVTLINADFSSEAGTKITTGFTGKVTGWTNLSGIYADSGVEAAGFAYSDASESGGAYQVVDMSSYSDFGVGSTFTLTWDSAPTSTSGVGDPMLVTLFSTPDDGPTRNTLASFTGNQVGPNGTWTTGYSITYTVTSADIGGSNKFGISFQQQGDGYAGFDNFALSYTPIPEPSSYMLGAAGILGTLILVRRRRK
jgi:hypothetical protein